MMDFLHVLKESSMCIQRYFGGATVVSIKCPSEREPRMGTGGLKQSYMINALTVAGETILDPFYSKKWDSLLILLKNLV